MDGQEVYSEINVQGVYSRIDGLIVVERTGGCSQYKQRDVCQTEKQNTYRKIDGQLFFYEEEQAKCFRV